MPHNLEMLETIAEVLDSVNVGCCVFDAEDRTLVWNRTMLVFFPEHAGFMHVGELYRDNLKRFYEQRLGPREMSQLDNYIEAGVQRHKTQRHPYNFEHRGIWLSVASLPLPAYFGGRVRMWSRLSNTAALDSDTTALSTLLYASILEAPKVVELFERMADGVMILDHQGNITSVNQKFAELYKIKNSASVTGLRFEDVFEMSWQGHQAKEEARYRQGSATLAEHLRFPGAPFHLPLPGGCWVRVMENSEPGGSSFSSHIDISAIWRD